MRDRILGMIGALAVGLAGSVNGQTPAPIMPGILSRGVNVHVEPPGSSVKWTNARPREPTGGETIHKNRRAQPPYVLLFIYNCSAKRFRCDCPGAAGEVDVYGKREDRLEPVPPPLPVHVHLRPSIGTADDGTDGDEQELQKGKGEANVLPSSFRHDHLQRQDVELAPAKDGANRQAHRSCGKY